MHRAGLGVVATVALLSAVACKARSGPPASTKGSAARPTSTAPVARVAPEPGLSEATLKTVDGRTRRYFAYWPKSAGSQPPLLLVLHGGGGNAEGAQTTSFTRDAAEKHGLLAVYPEGVSKTALGKRMATWNAGVCCGEAKKENVDDVAFLAALIEHLKARYPYDPDRVWATGISNGGMMATRLACERPELVAAISSIGSPGYACDEKMAEPVVAQIIHGTEDDCALYAGGEECGGCWERVVEELIGIPLPSRHFPCTGAEEQAAFWRGVNGCSTASEETYRKGDATCRHWSDCKSGKPVSLCTIDGGGHTWPGGKLGCDPKRRGCQIYADMAGPISRDLDANDAMVRFFGSGR